MRRRTLLSGLLLIAWAGAWQQTSADATGRKPKIAILSPNTPAHAKTPSSTLNSFLAGLADLGYVDGQTVSLEFRFASHALDHLPALAVELVATQPDVLWTWTSGGAKAAAAATQTVPIVVGLVNETTMAGLVSSFARPSGNITGLTLNSRLQHEKCLQLLKEAVPSIKRVGVLLNPLNPLSSNYPDVLKEPARALGIELIRAEARGVVEADQAFAAMASQDVDALFALNDTTLAGGTPVPKRLLELIDFYRLPSVSDEGGGLFAGAGGLMAFGTNEPATTRRSALMVHRILQGAKPSELPVEHPIEFRLIVNLKTARALGLTIPLSLLARADEVIE
jgi:putative ABC transport system substrate-binding protein